MSATGIQTSHRPSHLPLGVRLRSNCIHLPAFLAVTIFFGTISLIASLFDKTGRIQQRVAHSWARASVFCSGSRVQVSGLEHIPAGPAVYAANHTSYMDTPAVFSSLPFQFRILAKKELWGIPFIGWYLSRSGQIPIDTANPRASLSSLGNGVKALRDNLSVFVFPEGGRTPNGELKSFLNGAAYLAIRAQVPLVPIALVGIYDLLPIHARHFFPSRQPLLVLLGEPISTEGLTLRQADALTAQLREAIASLIEAGQSRR